MLRSKLVLGVVVALGVGGLGATAFALESDGGGGASAAHRKPTTTTEADTTTTSTTVAPTTTIAPAAEEPVTIDEPESDGDGVERSTDGCDGGTYTNHGDFVSSVAHNPDRQPGDMAAAAQSDCGKPLTSVGGEDETETPEAPEGDAPAPGASGDSHGGGQAGGQGGGQSGDRGKPEK